MTKKTSVAVFIPVIFSFFVMGFVDLVGVSTGYVKQDFNLSDSLAQLIPFSVFVWFALLSIPTGIFQDRKGKKLTVNIGLVITGIGLLIPFVHYSLTTALIGFAILGIGNTILQVSSNPLLIDISSPGTKAANLSMSQLVKAIASLLGPFITTALAMYLGNWRLVFPIFAAVSIISALWLRSVKIEESKTEKAPATFKSAFSLLKNPFILINVISIFFIVGFDVAMNSNIASYLVHKFGVSLEAANTGIMIYFASLMVGRAFGAVLLRKLNIVTFMVVSTIFTFAGLFGIIFSEDLLLTRILIFVTGLGFSNIFPIMFAIIVDKKPEYANELSGLIILAVSGGAVIPPVVGLLSDALGFYAAIYVLIFCMMYVAYSTYYVMKSK